MEVILLEKVANLGNLGDRVKVKPGYDRNYLIPKGKATETTAENIARVEARRAELESRAAESLASAQARAKHMALVPASGYLADSVAIPARQAIELLLNFQVFDF